MMGDDLLHHHPRVHALLRRRGVSLLETSVTLPHLIIDHETGVLLVDAHALRHPSPSIVPMVEHCESSYRALWILVLVDDRTRDAASNVAARVRLLQSDLCASPLRIAVRVARAGDAWESLHAILARRASSPISGRSPDSAWHEAEDTQHEAFLAACGFNPWAARLALEHYTLRDLLSMPHALRRQHLGWVPERALSGLGFVAGGAEVETGGGGEGDDGGHGEHRAMPPVDMVPMDADGPGCSTDWIDQAPRPSAAWPASVLAADAPKEVAPPAPQLSISASAIHPDGQRQLCWGNPTAAAEAAGPCTTIMDTDSPATAAPAAPAPPPPPPPPRARAPHPAHARARTWWRVGIRSSAAEAWSGCALPAPRRTGVRAPPPERGGRGAARGSGRASGWSEAGALDGRVRQARCRDRPRWSSRRWSWAPLSELQTLWRPVSAATW